MAYEPKTWDEMSMGHGGKKVRGWPNSCPNSPEEQKRHMVTVLSCVQSIEHFRCDICGAEWSD